MTKKELERFKTFLVAAGAELLTTTNKWEVLRFKANGETGIVYKNKFGQFTYVHQAKDAYEAFSNKSSWDGKKEVVKRKKSSILIRSLIKRDGKSCFYCDQTLEEDEMTVEHLFSINQGGTNHISNLAISCKPCNNEAGHLSVVEKVKLRETKFKTNNSNFKEAI
jgi:5-methylcytosine-specific restriction endonuclease McrA